MPNTEPWPGDETQAVSATPGALTRTVLCSIQNTIQTKKSLTVNEYTFFLTVPSISVLVFLIDLFV